MILSERELEIGKDHGGIMLLDDALDRDAARRVSPRRRRLEIETGYNRPDLTSIYGIAREVAALTGATLAADARQGSRTRRVTRRSTSGSRISNVPPLPRRDFRRGRGRRLAWLKARLLRPGMRPISNTVDVTNYVMLSLGDPMHAFDYGRSPRPHRRSPCATPGEKLVTLDGSARKLDPEDLVIADAERPIGIAGVMGGENTEISEARPACCWRRRTSIR